MLKNNDLNNDWLRVTTLLRPFLDVLARSAYLGYRTLTTLSYHLCPMAQTLLCPTPQRITYLTAAGQVGSIRNNC